MAGARVPYAMLKRPQRGVDVFRMRRLLDHWWVVGSGLVPPQRGTRHGYQPVAAEVALLGQALGVNVHGIRLTPWMNALRSSSGSPASMSGITRNISPKIAFSCVRASEAPMQ